MTNFIRDNIALISAGITFIPFIGIIIRYAVYQYNKNELDEILTNRNKNTFDKIISFVITGTLVNLVLNVFTYMWRTDNDAFIIIISLFFSLSIVTILICTLIMLFTRKTLSREKSTRERKAMPIVLYIASIIFLFSYSAIIYSNDKIEDAIELIPTGCVFAILLLFLFANSVEHFEIGDKRKFKVQYVRSKNAIDEIIKTLFLVYSLDENRQIFAANKDSVNSRGQLVKPPYFVCYIKENILAMYNKK